MDDILDIGNLSRVNKELKSMDRYFESIQKRARNLGFNNFQRQKVVIDQTTESVKRLSNALSNLTSRLYKINRLTKNLSGIRIAVKCSCSKDCSQCKSKSHNKVSSSNGFNHSLINLQNKTISQLGLQNRININKSTAPGVPLKTSISNAPSKSVNSQSPATKNTEKQKIVLIKPVMDTMAFIKTFSKPKDVVETLNEAAKAYKAITPSQVATMPPWLQTAKTKIDDVVNKIKTSTIYTRAASMYSGAPSWVKTGLKGAGKLAKSAIVFADAGYDVSEILNATGEKKYKLIGEFVGSKIGNIVGKSVGGATVAIPYVGPVIAPIASLALGAAGEWLGGIGGGKIMEKVWYAKTHLKGWTKSLNAGIDTTTKDFKQSMNGFNNEVANKTNNIKTTAPATIDSWSNKIVNFIGNKSESAIGNVENITGKVSRNIPLFSGLANNANVFLKNKISGVSSRLKGYVPGLAEGVKEKINNISEGTKNFSNKLNNFVQKNADPFKEKVKKATTKTSEFLQMILDSPEKLNWELFMRTEKTAAKKVPNKSSRNSIASSRTYRANDRHRKTAVHSVKSTNRNTSNMQVNMPTGAIQIAVGERVNFDALASEVGKRFAVGFRQAMNNNKTARA